MSSSAAFVSVSASSFSLWITFAILKKVAALVLYYWMLTCSVYVPITWWLVSHTITMGATHLHFLKNRHCPFSRPWSLVRVAFIPYKIQTSQVVLHKKFHQLTAPSPTNSSLVPYPDAYTSIRPKHQKKARSPVTLEQRNTRHHAPLNDHRGQILKGHRTEDEPTIEPAAAKRVRARRPAQRNGQKRRQRGGAARLPLLPLPREGPDQAGAGRHGRTQQPTSAAACVVGDRCFGW